jgi:REP element-mobilizing transposase RayT
MRKLEPIEPDHYYHLYNCGINGETIFKEASNYNYFLNLYDKYINDVAETFAWCLMPNHFHLLVRIKAEEEIVDTVNPERVQNPFLVKKHITQKFSNLFNSYAQAFNKRFNRHGSLFEKPFKRKLIDSEEYFRRLVIYIHNNPVHHGFCKHPIEYGWSSYLTCVSLRPTKLKREMVMAWFDDLANFKYLHNEKVEVTKIEKWLEL